MREPGTKLQTVTGLCPPLLTNQRQELLLSREILLPQGSGDIVLQGLKLVYVDHNRFPWGGMRWFVPRGIHWAKIEVESTCTNRR